MLEIVWEGSRGFEHSTPFHTLQDPSNIPTLVHLVDKNYIIRLTCLHSENFAGFTQSFVDHIEEISKIIRYTDDKPMVVFFFAPKMLLKVDNDNVRAKS